MSLVMLSGVYTHVNQGGTSRLIGVGANDRYNRLNAQNLQNLGIYNNLSSATVYASSAVDATLIFFRSFFPSIPSNYDGFFMQITNRRGSGSDFDVDNFGTFGFNDLTTSILAVAVNKGTELRFSFRDIFLERWNTVIDSQLSDGARRDGDPILTWEMYPQGISFLDSNQRYLKVHQPIIIEFDFWWDYKASITYHIYLGLDSGGHLFGNVVRWAYWIEGGIKTGGIESRLRPAVISGASTLDSELDTQLGGFSGFTFRDLYYLPGRQTTRAPTGVRTGTTFDDVTIVLQL